MTHVNSVAELPGQHFAERYVEADGFVVRYLECGSGEPLVWLHGGGGLTLTRAHELLAEHFRLIAIEVPGFGDSPANERSTSFTDLATTIRVAAEALELERFHLWGTSFGSLIAFELARSAPELLHTLVLEGPGVILRPEGLPRPSQTREEMMRRVYAHPERQAWRPRLDEAVVAKQRAVVTRLARLSRDETEAALRQINVPTLVVFGTADGVISSTFGRVYRELMPNCHFVLVYDAGHEVAAERPEAFSSLVVDFLQRREAFIVNQRSSLINP